MGFTNMRGDLIRLATGLLAMALAGCAGAPPLAERETKAASVAQQGELEKFRIATTRFDLVGFRNIRTPGEALTVFIEGDGAAWQTRNKPSSDPTPVSMTMLAVAASDPGPNTVYLARPCQFTGAENGTARNCRPELWTLAPYSEEVVAAMNEALNKIKAQTGSSSLRLVGYSGGGAIATLLAARRKDVTSLVTIAGLLDNAEFTSFHHVRPLDYSLDPLSVAATIARLPQIHYSGGEDDIVPPTIAASFIRHMPVPNCARQIVLSDMEHQGDWAARWPALSTRPPSCPGDLPKSAASTRSR
ncbi:alpha/beta fold hydrolase [Parvibaculum sp.]|uniref:alpha/beta fold hydrolase n=1 Tax=Parvibaculum sp. TaxID=2024848 RepID=UPI0025DFC3C5|nr:alpha/beta fold hydrolase [Parvibaculum sp.]